MSTTRLQEIQICFGKGKQTDIATAQTAANMWQLRKLNAALALMRSGDFRARTRYDRPESQRRSLPLHSPG